MHNLQLFTTFFNKTLKKMKVCIYFFANLAVYKFTKSNYDEINSKS